MSAKGTGPAPKWFHLAVKALFDEAPLPGHQPAQFTPAAAEAWWQFLGGLPRERLENALENCPRPVWDCGQIRDYANGRPVKRDEPIGREMPAAETPWNELGERDEEAA